MQDQIRTLLVTEFEKSLFDSAIYNLNDAENKLRYNNFAYSIRELSRHFLYRLGPEEEVQLCSWYEVLTANGKPTRIQRIKYAIQGGIPDTVIGELGMDAAEILKDIKDIKKSIDSLSKYTHINPESYDIKDREIIKMSDEILGHFKLFAERIDACRSDLRSALDIKIEEQMIDAIISTSYQNVDMLAPRYSLEYYEITEYHIIDINSSNIVVEVLGNVHFTLQYGSNKERRKGDGLDLNESFPFQTNINYEFSGQFPSCDYEIEAFDVDTNEWYGEEYTDEELDSLCDNEIL